MSNITSKNEGVRNIGFFEDRAIALNEPAGTEYSGNASRSANEGIHFLADFQSEVQPLSSTEADTSDALNGRFAQQEKKFLSMVNKLQERIEELQRQYADLRGVVTEQDRLIHRYMLDGPSSEEI